MESTHIKFVDYILLEMSQEFLKTGLDFKIITINWINDLKSISLNSMQLLHLGKKIRKWMTGCLTGPWYSSKESEHFSGSQN